MQTHARCLHVPVLRWKQGPHSMGWLVDTPRVRQHALQIRLLQTHVGCLFYCYYYVRFTTVVASEGCDYYYYYQQYQFLIIIMLWYTQNIEYKLGQLFLISYPLSLHFPLTTASAASCQLYHSEASSPVGYYDQSHIVDYSIFLAWLIQL